MPYQIVKHTADIRLFIEADTEQDLFRDALLGLMGLIYPESEKVQKKVKRVVSLTAPDITVLLIDFLSDALTSAHTNKEVYSNVEIKSLGQNNLEAILIGDKVDHFKEDVKAVTYHEAEVKKNERGKWETTLVLDI